MTKQEFTQIIAGLKALYADPKYIAGETAWSLWYTLIGGYDYAEVQAAVLRYMTTETRPPMPADILRQIGKVQDVKLPLTEAEAWSAVVKCVCGLDWNDPKAKYDTLPELCKKLVSLDDVIRWAKGEGGDLEMNPHTSFRKSYEVLAKREAEEAQIPPTLKAKIDSVRQIALNKQSALEAKDA